MLDARIWGMSDITATVLWVVESCNIIELGKVLVFNEGKEAKKMAA